MNQQNNHSDRPRKPQNNGKRGPKSPNQRKNEKNNATRRAAQAASRRIASNADKTLAKLGRSELAEQPKRRANVLDTGTPKLRVTGLGGMDSGGSKNMLVIEYGNDAIVTDVGLDLGADLPGINFAIPDVTYLEKIKRKLRGYVFTHGHLDHIGGAPYIIPKMPAPVYGTKFTLAMLQRIWQNSPVYDQNFDMQQVVMNQDNNERLKVGPFVIELVRMTHSIPDSSAIVIDTPAGRIINSGDFRLDPEPLDHKQTDIARLKELGNEGVLMLMSECTTTDRLGRTPSEHTLQATFHELIKFAPGRVFVAMFSTNINRIQMVINAGVEHNRKVAFDGRSMLATLETAVRSGLVKIPKGTVIPMSEANNVPDKGLIVISTGAQGEENSALRRMSTGDHKFIKLKARDTIILSSTPIPTTGNDALVEHMVDDAMRIGVHVFQHTHRDVDNIGPLHVSGHASRDEYRELIEILKPKFFMPIYGNFSKKKYHIDLAVEAGVPRDRSVNAELGDVVEVDDKAIKIAEHVPVGSVLVDNTGAIVPSIVVKDRLLMSEDGIITIILTLKKGSGQLMTSPDIISRGFVYIKESEELMAEIRKEARFFALRKFKSLSMDQFKNELKDHLQHIIFKKTERTPIVIAVVNLIGGNGGGQQNGQKRPTAPSRADMLMQDQSD